MLKIHMENQSVLSSVFPDRRILATSPAHRIGTSKLPKEARLQSISCMRRPRRRWHYERNKQKVQGQTRVQRMQPPKGPLRCDAEASMQQLPVSPGDMCHFTLAKGTVSRFDFFNRARHPSAVNPVVQEHPLRHRGRRKGRDQKGFVRRHHHANRLPDIHVNLVSRARKMTRGRLMVWTPLGSQVRYRQENRRAHQATAPRQQCLLHPMWWQASRLRLLQVAAVYSLGSRTSSLWYHRSVQVFQMPRGLPTAGCLSLSKLPRRLSHTATLLLRQMSSTSAREPRDI